MARAILGSFVTMPSASMHEVVMMSSAPICVSFMVSRIRTFVEWVNLGMRTFSNPHCLAECCREAMGLSKDLGKIACLHSGKGRKIVASIYFKSFELYSESNTN